MATLEEAERLLAAGDVVQADSLLHALHDPRAPNPRLLLAWGRLRRRIGNVQPAFEMLRQAVAAGGGDDARIELAGVLTDLGRAAEAARLLAPLRGTGAALAYERGRVEQAAGRSAAALAQFRGATRADPGHSAARLAAARLHLAQNDPKAAEAALRALLTREPAHLEAIRELAYLLGAQRRYRESLTCYDQLERAGADIVRDLAMLTLGFLHSADWSVRDQLRARLEARFRREAPCVVDAYALFALSDDPAMHRLMATRIAQAIERHAVPMARPAARPVRGEGRLRVGYLSGDFNQHATSLLLAGVIEAHDRERFEIVAYDYSIEDDSPTRARMQRAFERFERLGAEGPAASAARIAADEIDILIDLKGYTERTRSEILALRPAPIQAQFLGHPGTQGGTWTDYVIADRHVLPPTMLDHFAEQPVWLPASCYPSDRSRPTPEPDRNRLRHNLPEQGFVFGCFNNPFKLSPDYFAIWMGLLRAVPESVLWLYQGNDLMADNLRREAGRDGVDPERLTFARPADLGSHIARHGCLDLFLDTAPYGAHTTALDALWAGVPVLTCAGAAWPSRVGASLLHAAGVPELVVESQQAYAALALALARDPDRLAGLRARVAAARTAGPLFDAAAFARGLEQAFVAMAERSRGGAAPAAIAVG